MTGYPIIEMGKALKLLRDRMRTELKQSGLLRGQIPVIHALTECEGLTQSELACQLCIQPATVSNTIDRMVKATLVERRDDPQDQRVSRIYLTPHGRALRAHVQTATQQVADDALAGFDPSEKELLITYIHRIIDNLEQSMDKSELSRC